jgi:hypothetical protein
MIRELIDGFWTYTLAIAGGLLFAWLLASPANAEPVVLSFTDPENCPPCKVLDRSWQQARPATRRIVVDVRFADRSYLAKWGVDSWPDSVLVEIEGDKVTRVYRRHVGSMTPAELLKFCEVPK